jgi:FtsZ-binding cell division protein ZapB
MANSGNQPLSSSDLEAIDTYKTLVESKQKEIVALTSEVEELQVSREKYASDHSTEIQGQYDNLRLENNELKDRFEKGAVPQLSNFMVKGGATEDGIFNTSVKSKKIKRLRFSFDILENPLIIKPIKEEIIIRVISESGAVLSTTELNGKMMSTDEVYTLKDEIQIEAKMQGSAPQVLWFPEDEELQDRLSKGTYIIQLISRDKIKQIVEFSVN